MIAALALLLLKASQPAPPTAVEGVTVTASSRESPAVAATWPAQGAAVTGGTMVLKVVFSQAMSPAGWRFSPVEGLAYPRCLDRPRLLPDGKTFVLLCVTTDSGAWGVRLNGPSGEGPGFASPGGRPLAPYDLKFTTTADRPVASLEDAMTAASLTDGQGPIMDDKAQRQAGAAPPATLEPSTPPG